MIRHWRAGVIALWVGFGGAFPAEADPPRLSPHEIATAGIETATLTASRSAGEIVAQGTVLDPAAVMLTQSRLATAAANLAAARATLDFAAAQAAQNSKLYSDGHNISQSAWQSSIAAAARAKAAVTAAAGALAAERAAARTQWGAALTDALLTGAPIVDAIANGGIAVIGVSLPPGVAIAQPPARAAAELAGQTCSLTLIGGIPRMLAGIPGEAVLYAMPAQPALPIGVSLAVRIAAGTPTEGVVVPASAVIWRDGSAIAYRADAGGRFEPVDISTAAPVPGGYFVASKLTPGEHVVTQGAELLAAMPTSPAANAAAGAADPDGD